MAISRDKKRTAITYSIIGLVVSGILFLMAVEYWYLPLPLIVGMVISELFGRDRKDAQEELNGLKVKYQTGEIDLDRLIDLCYQVGTRNKS
ncbi:MAG: hypothetical protein CMB89_10315 [Flammeovirgaceae bacterium]|nr:hypothetical protein [Flammeovirgaceae bacterium]|tara:strand:+ start:479 stop:751 length:273 start_codon:yes stop_codon:yes gene_type:complete